MIRRLRIVKPKFIPLWVKSDSFHIISGIPVRAKVEGEDLINETYASKYYWVGHVKPFLIAYFTAFLEPEKIIEE